MELFRIKSRLTKKELLFYTAFGINIFRRLLQVSLINYITPSFLYRGADYLVLILLLVQWISYEKFTIKKLLVWGISLSTCLLMFIMHGYLSPLIAISLVLSAQDIKIERLVKFSSRILLSITLIVVGSYALGIVQDYTYVHRVGGELVTAHSYGFKYYGTIGYIFMTLTASYLFLHKKSKVIVLIILFFVNYWAYSFHTTRLAFYVSVAFIIFYILLNRFEVIKLKLKIWKPIAAIFPTLLCFVTYVLVRLYSQGGRTALLTVFNTINSRFAYSAEAVREYGICLMGSKVIMYGNEKLIYGNATTGFYIDSGYIYSLVAYGIIMTVVILILYTILLRYLVDEKAAFLTIWTMFLLVCSMMNDFLLSPEYNLVMFLIPQAIISAYKKRQKHNEVSKVMIRKSISRV